MAGIFILPILTRYLTSNDYGIFGVVLSYVGLITIASDLGLTVVLVNSFYKYPKKWPLIWRQLHFVLQVWSIFYSLIIAGLLVFIIPGEAKENALWIILLVCIPTAFFNPVQILGARYYQFAQKPVYIATTSAVVGTVSIVMNLVTIVFLKMGYMGWFISSFVAYLTQYLFYFYPVYFRYKLTPLFVLRRRFVARHLKVSLPTIPHNYSSYLLNSSDRVVMDRMKVPIGQIGQYNMAYIFGSYFEVFSEAIGMAIGPFYVSLASKRNREQDESLHTITHWLLFGFIALGFLVSLWSKELLDFLIKNDELKSVYPLAIIIIMSYVYKPYYWVCVNRLQFHERTAQLWKISFVAGALNVILNIIFVPFFGIKAAAIVTFLSLLYMGFAGYFLKAFKDIEPAKYQPLPVIAVILSVTVLVYSLKDISPILKVPISFVVLGSFLAFTLRKREFFKTVQV